MKSCHSMNSTDLFDYCNPNNSLVVLFDAPSVDSGSPLFSLLPVESVDIYDCYQKAGFSSSRVPSASDLTNVYAFSSYFSKDCNSTLSQPSKM